MYVCVLVMHSVLLQLFTITVCVHSLKNAYVYLEKYISHDLSIYTTSLHVLLSSLHPLCSCFSLSHSLSLLPFHSSPPLPPPPSLSPPLSFPPPSLSPPLSFPPHPQVYSVRVRVDSDRVLAMLLEKAQFGIARKYAGIVGSTASEITVKEVGMC